MAQIINEDADVILQPAEKRRLAMLAVRAALGDGESSQILTELEARITAKFEANRKHAAKAKARAKAKT
jgi:hypothetical protein